LIYIGGVSGAGKSVSAKKLSAHLALPIVVLDSYFRMLRRTGCGDDAARDGMPQLAQALIEDLLQANARCIVEGGWLAPDAIAGIQRSHQGRLHAAYCGIPDADVETLLRNVIARGEHWLAKEPVDVAKAILHHQVSGSRWYQAECRKFGIRFFDFSDQEAGARDLIQYFNGSVGPFRGAGGLSDRLRQLLAAVRPR